VFDQIAEEYDRWRPAYPDELVDRALEVAAIGSGDRVLEVGCGSGQLTRSLLARGLNVTAIEPGAQLRSLAERNLGGAGEIQFVDARFEDAELREGGFQAIFSAAAFHWVDPDAGWERAARLLAPDGTLALIQYCALDDPASSRDHEALLAAMTRVAPELAAAWPPVRDLATILAGVQERRENISEVWAWIGRTEIARPRAAEVFGEIQIATMPTVFEQTADEVNSSLRTTSPFQRLDADRRQVLEDENTAIYERLGRPIRSDLLAVLVAARRR
jgi:SAM-dependent methyltransferase